MRDLFVVEIKRPMKYGVDDSSRSVRDNPEEIPILLVGLGMNEMIRSDSKVNVAIGIAHAISFSGTKTVKLCLIS